MVGSHIAEHFAAQGHEIVTLDNRSRPRSLGYSLRRPYLAWDALRKYPGVKRIAGDIRRTEDLRRAFARGADLVVHAAGQVGVQESLRHPLRDGEINILGTERLLEATRRWCPGATVIFCSTNKVYGDSVNTLPTQEKSKRYVWRNHRIGIAEDWPVDRTGHTPYGVSKLAADLYVQEYGYSYGLRTAVFRMSCILGERQLGMTDQGWVAWMALATWMGWPITVYGTGKQVRDLLYVRDLARLCELYYRSGCSSEVFNVGGGPHQTASVLEILLRLEKLLRRPPKVRFAPGRLHDQRIYISDIRRAKRRLGWFPRVGIEESLRRVCRWITEHSHLFQG